MYEGEKKITQQQQQKSQRMCMYVCMLCLLANYHFILNFIISVYMLGIHLNVNNGTICAVCESMSES